MDLFSIFLQTPCSLYLLAPFLALNDLYSLQQVSKYTKLWITLLQKCGCINKRIVVFLLQLVHGNHEALDQILSLWRNVPKDCQLFLTGSALLWCLTPSERWRPHDIDLLLFQPAPAELPFFIDEKLERQVLSGEGYEQLKKRGKPWLCCIDHSNHVADDQWYRGYFLNDHRRKFHAQWRRVRCELPALAQQDKKNLHLDVVLRVGDAKSDPWEHLSAFDLSFLQNSWTPTGHLRIFDMQALCHQCAIHCFPNPVNRLSRDYWNRRADKYKSRGFLIESEIRLTHKRKRITWPHQVVL